MAEIFAFAVDHDRIRDDDIDLGTRRENLADSRQCSWEVLFIAIQIREHVASGSLEAAVNRVVHAGVLFDEGADAWIVWEPVLRAIVGAGVLNDVFDLHAVLIGHRRDTEL